MVKNRQVQSKMRTSYYLEPGQTLKNTKISDRRLMLVAPLSEYKRFIDYTNESERMAINALKEKAKIDAIRKATYEMSKNWDNTNANIKKRRRDELLAKRKQEDDIREKFAKEIAEQNAAERAQVVKEARRLLLYKKPQCRLLNGALLTSECFRERDAQLAFEKTLEGFDEEREKEVAIILKKEAEAAKEADYQKAVEQSKRNKAYGAELEKQIRENKSDRERAEREEYLMGKQDLINISRDLRLMKECEDEQALNRKIELNKLVTDAIEEKKNFEIEAKRESEFRDRALEVFERSKRRIENMKKLKRQEELEAKMRQRNDYMGEKFCAVAAKKQAEDESAEVLEAQRQLDARNLAFIEAKRQKALENKMECIKIGENAENEKRRRDEELKEFNTWEMLQRLKRDEYNKEFEIEERKREWEKKMTTAKDLRKQMSENERRRIREKEFENDQSSALAIIEKTNKKVLDYGQEILDESRGVRPLFPILKTIQKFKIENGLIERKTFVENNILAPAKKPNKRMPICLAPVPEQEVIYI